MAENTLKVDKSTVHVAEVVRHGDRLTIPANMTYEQALDLILRRRDYDEKTVGVNRVYDAFWTEGAIALDKVLTERFGWSPHTHTLQQTMFGKKVIPPQNIDVETSYGQHKSVPWGSFLIPGTEAVLNMENVNTAKITGAFAITGEVKRKWQPQVDELLAAVHSELQANSLYKGKAWSIDFQQDGLPHFVDTDVDTSQLIFSKSVWDAVETSIFTPLQRYADLKASNLPFKRGVGLVGDFGTGKTLAAKVASRYAVENGITFIVCKHAAQIATTIELARIYQPAVVFVEDLDREVQGERTDVMDLVLNTIDGIDGKKAEIMIVYTSNNVEAIHKAALRPGRTDAVIEVLPPDREAVERLIRYYGRGVVPSTEDVSEAALQLEGRIPAVIAEVVKRAKLSMLKLVPRGERVKHISGEALKEAATSMKMQLDLLYGRRTTETPITIESLVTNSVREGFNSHLDKIDRTHKLAVAINDKV